MGQYGGKDDFGINRKRTSQFSVPLVHCPEVKAIENCQYTVVLDLETIDTIFRIIVSVNQLSVYGAVAEMCEEYSFKKLGHSVVKGHSSSSFVSSVIKTEVPLDCDHLA